MKRPIRVEGNVAYVLLAGGLEATIDAEDAPTVGQHSWCLDGRGYAVTNLRLSNGKRRRLKLHRLVMGEPEGLDIDHVEGIKLDNRKSQLRVCTASQNGCNQGMQSRNTSGRKGVTWKKQTGKWGAKICHEGKHIHLGYFTDLEEAARAYKEAAITLHKEFARFERTKPFSE